MSAAIEQRNQEATCYVGNLDEKVNEEILWELMVQCGPVVNVHMPKDKVSGKHLGYGFVEFRGEEDAEYAMKIMNMIKVFGKALKLNKASADKRQNEIGANVFIGNLDPDVDEKLLHDTFSAFGGILITPKIMRDSETGISKGYGFVSFDSFEASDLAIECMNGQFLSNRAISVQYAFKKDTPGELHGSQAERMLAASQPQRFKPHTIFSGGAGDSIVNMSSSLVGLQNQLAYQQQQQALQNQMQMTAYGQQMAMGAMGYPSMPMPMQMQMSGMPQAPSALPQYMQPMGMPMPPMSMPMPPPPPQQVHYGGMDMSSGAPPPPPPMAMMMNIPQPPQAYMPSFPPPPPPPPQM